MGNSSMKINEKRTRRPRGKRVTNTKRKVKDEIENSSTEHFAFTNASAPKRMETKDMEHFQFPGTSDGGKSVKSEPLISVEGSNSNSSLEENNYDFEQDGDKNLGYDKSVNLEHQNNFETTQEENKNKLLKQRLIMLEEHEEKMKLFKLQYDNELLKNSLLKQALENLDVTPTKDFC